MMAPKSKNKNLPVFTSKTTQHQATLRQQTLLDMVHFHPKKVVYEPPTPIVIEPIPPPPTNPKPRARDLHSVSVIESCLVDSVNELVSDIRLANKQTRGAYTSYTQYQRYMLVKAKLYKWPNWEKAVARVPKQTFSTWNKIGLVELARRARTLEGKLFKRVKRRTSYYMMFHLATLYFKTARETLSGVNLTNIKTYCCRINNRFKNTKERNQWRLLYRWRVSQNLSLRRTTGISQLLPQEHEALVADFFLMLRRAFLARKPYVIIVLDETAVYWDPAHIKVLASYGAKNVTVQCANEKTCTTVLLAGKVEVNYDRSGNVIYEKATHIFPHVVFDGTELTPVTKKETVVSKKAREFQNKYDVTTCVTKKGWIDAKSMFDWVKRLERCDKGGWLIMDLYCAHRVPEVIDMVREKGYIPFFIPGGCTSKVQVHDVVINKPFKSEIRKWVCEQKYQASRKKSKWVPSREELVKSVHDAMKVVSVDLLVTGVTKCVLPDAVVHGTGNWSKQPSPLTKTEEDAILSAISKDTQKGVDPLKSAENVEASIELLFAGMKMTYTDPLDELAEDAKEADEEHKEFAELPDEVIEKEVMDVDSGEESDSDSVVIVEENDEADTVDVLDSELESALRLYENEDENENEEENESEEENEGE